MSIMENARKSVMGAVAAQRVIAAHDGKWSR